MSKMFKEQLEEVSDKKKMSPRELEFMHFIWKYPNGISSEVIYAHFPQTRSTKSTVLSCLSKKGYVENKQEGLHHIYKPIVTKIEYEQEMIRQQLEGLLGSSSLSRFVAAFSGRETLTEKQNEKVKELLEALEKEV